MPTLHFYDRGPDRPWRNPLLTSASIVGHVTTSTVRLWVRVWEPGTYHLIISETAILGESLVGVTALTELPQQMMSLDLSYETDLTGVFDVVGLDPETMYYYALLNVEKNPAKENAFRWELPPDVDNRRFRTQPTAPQRLTFGLFSCHMPYSKNGDVVNLQMWDRFAEELGAMNADFVLAGGDQVYTDGNDTVSIWRWLKKVKNELGDDEDKWLEYMRSWYRDIYRGYWGPPAVRWLLERFPTYMIWDDHEIMDGWGSYTKRELANELDTFFEWQNTERNLALANRMFDAARLTYFEYEHSHNPPTASNVWDYPIQWGDWPFFVLDMRGHRDFNRRTADKILGKAQWNRFEAWLDSPKVKAAKVAFIVSPVPMVHASNFVVNYLDLPFLGIADDLRDEWEHKSNWTERNMLLERVFQRSHETGCQFVFLSGDVHVAAAFKLFKPKYPNAQVFQLTSSSITYANVPKALKFAVRKTGSLGDKATLKPAERTDFTLLHDVMTQNNFGIVRVEADAMGTPRVTWHLFGSTGNEDEIMRLRALTLK